ncbi:MAG: hypothetical protein L0H73_07945 [Nitrococcus sp.]|nr:hypothetical protein [Nitrococcus sp.]
MLAVPDAVVDALKAWASDDGCVVMEAAGNIRRDERLRITKGPFARLEGLFQAREGKDCVIQLLEIMRRSQRLEFPATVVARA